MDEFDLIEKYFTWEHSTSLIDSQSTIAMGVGDDAAVLNIPPNTQLVTSIDTLVSGVHFPENTPADAVGHKALAVNLSDLAAMGAKPVWFTLALTLPEINHGWLEDFSAGLKKLAQQTGIQLVGGDTTRGPLSISIQVMGLVESNQSLLRSGAKSGDKIYVTGTLGDAAAGLQTLKDNLTLSDKAFCVQRLNYPQPRLAESEFIHALANSCIDISDGLLQDLAHILKASNKGAELDLSLIPFSKALNNLNKKQALSFALAGGDDYELLFTIPSEAELIFLEKCQQPGYQFTCIGVINDLSGSIVDAEGNSLMSKGYNHFYEQ